MVAGICRITQEPKSKRELKIRIAQLKNREETFYKKKKEKSSLEPWSYIIADSNLNKGNLTCDKNVKLHESCCRLRSNALSCSRLIAILRCYVPNDGITRISLIKV